MTGGVREISGVLGVIDMACRSTLKPWRCPSSEVGPNLDCGASGPSACLGVIWKVLPTFSLRRGMCTGK